MNSDRPQRKRPMYREVAALLREAISLGRYAPGDRLPSETQLMRRHHVSRVVAKAAMNILKQDGIADGRQGSGVFVRQSFRLTREGHGRARALPAPGWLEPESFGGGVLDRTTHRQEKIEADVLIAERLAILAGVSVVQTFDRYMRTDGRPLQLVAWWQLDDLPGDRVSRWEKLPSALSPLHAPAR